MNLSSNNEDHGSSDTPMIRSADPHDRNGVPKKIMPNDSHVSCTVFNAEGDIVAVSKRFPKIQFLKDNRFFARDLRKIDASSIDVAPSIMVRPNSLLINLLHIKAIIKRLSVLVFDTNAPQASSELGKFMYELELRLKASNQNVCYEFRALESILISVMSLLETECKSHVRACGDILSELEDLVDRTKLQSLLIKLKLLTSYYQKAVLIRDTLEELLDNDEDLAGMYLTNIQMHDSTKGNYEDLEMILESYYNQCDEFVQQAGALISDIKVTEEIVNIILDTSRNSLMLFELKLTVYTLGFTVVALLPAFYGMNLKNYIEDTSWGFGTIVLVALLQGAIITLFNLRKLKRVQKLTMAGTGSGNHPAIPIRSISNSPQNLRLTSSSGGYLHRDSWYYRLFFGSRETKYIYPSSKDRDAIWRMIHADSKLK